MSKTETVYDPEYVTGRSRINGGPENYPLSYADGSLKERPCVPANSSIAFIDANEDQTDMKAVVAYRVGDIGVYVTYQEQDLRTFIASLTSMADTMAEGKLRPGIPAQMGGRSH